MLGLYGSVPLFKHSFGTISDSNIVCTPLLFVILNKKFSQENVTPYGEIWKHVNFGVIKSHPNVKYLHYRFASGDFEGEFAFPSSHPKSPIINLYMMGNFTF